MSQNSKFGLDNHGVLNAAATHWNQGAERLYEDTVRQGLGTISEGGALVVETGKYTGRSANDKFIVEEESSRDNIWWGPVNKPIAPERFQQMRTKMLAYFQNRELYVQDVYAGADPQFRLSVRVISDSPWHSLFVRNMFIPVPAAEVADFVPEVTILHAPMMNSDPAADGVNSEAFILMNFGERMMLIGGTRYAGEIKKSIFGYLNYLLPERGVLPMHCSANIGGDGTTSIFFGRPAPGRPPCRRTARGR